MRSHILLKLKVKKEYVKRAISYSLFWLKKRIKHLFFLFFLAPFLIKKNIKCSLSTIKEIEFPVFFTVFGFKPKIKLILEKTRRNPLWPFKSYWQESVATLLMFSLLFSSFIFSNPRKVEAATYNFIQTDWSSGATSSSAIHTDNRTNWTYYSSVDDGIMNSTVLDQKLVTDHIVITTSFKPGKVYQYQIESIDSFSNITLSKNHTVLTPQPKQNVVDVIINNFEESFGFLKRLKF